MYDRQVRDDTEESALQLRRFAEAEQLDDSQRFNILTHSGASLATFTDVRRSIWPDEEFYAESFHGRRLQFAALVISHGASLPSLPNVVRSILFDNGRSPASDPEVGAEVRLMGMIAGSIVTTLRTLGNWPAASEVLLRARLWDSYRNLVVEIVSTTDKFYEDHSVRRIPRCLCNTIVEIPRNLNDYVYLGNTKQMDLAQRALQVWLELLQEAGVKLSLYGELEKPLLDFYRTTTARRSRESSRRAASERRIKAALIGIQYGPKPHDWMFWWREPTDSFVGEFWKLLEHETPLLPGSWVDDEEDSSDYSDDGGDVDAEPKLWGFPNGR